MLDDDVVPDQSGELGKAYGSAPGFHLLVGPNCRRSTGSGRSPASTNTTTNTTSSG